MPASAELVDLRQHLVGIADDRRPGAGAGPAHPGPQVTLDVPLVVGLVAQRRLAGHAGRRRVERPLTDRRAGGVVELREQPARRGAGLVLGLAHHHVGTPSVAQPPALGVRPGVHVGLHVEHLGRGVRPHEEHVRTARRALPRVGRQTAEVEQRAGAGLGAHPRRVDLEIDEVTVELHGVAVEELAQGEHHLGRAAIARARWRASHRAGRWR